MRYRGMMPLMDQALLVAIARFPDRGHAIKELAGADDEFRSLCADLADAVSALHGWERSTSPVKVARCAEYQELVSDLTAEVEVALDRAKAASGRGERRGR